MFLTLNTWYFQRDMRPSECAKKSHQQTGLADGKLPACHPHKACLLLLHWIFMLFWWEEVRWEGRGGDTRRGLGTGMHRRLHPSLWTDGCGGCASGCEKALDLLQRREDSKLHKYRNEPIFHPLLVLQTLFMTPKLGTRHRRAYRCD